MEAGLVEFALLVLMALIALTLVVTGVLVLSSEFRMGQRLSALDGPSAAATETPLPKWYMNFLATPGKDREEIESYLAAAGYRDPRAPIIFGLARLAAVIGFGAAGYLISKSLGHPALLPLLFGLMGACIGYLTPKQFLRMSKSRRDRKITAELPFTLDILVMMLESGISIDQCFRTFALTEGKAAPLIQESIAILVRDLDIGTPYDQALSRWADRMGIDGARELAAVIQQALMHGTSLARVLKDFSREYSEKRIASAREAVNKKSVKMTVVMILFIMPALLIVLVGPAVISLAATMRELAL